MSCLCLQPRATSLVLKYPSDFTLKMHIVLTTFIFLGIFQGCVRYGTYRGIPPVFPPVYTLPSVSVRSVQASIPYRKFRYARYSPPYPTENLGIRRKNTESSVGVPVRPPYPTENLGTLGIDLHTLPNISVRSVQPSYPTENLGIRRENTESSVGVSVQPIPYRKKYK